MPVIDAHVHVLPNFPAMAPWEDLGRVDRLLHHMDDCDVDKAVVLPVVAGRIGRRSVAMSRTGRVWK